MESLKHLNTLHAWKTVEYLFSFPFKNISKYPTHVPIQTNTPAIRPTHFQKVPVESFIWWLVQLCGGENASGKKKKKIL